MALRHLGHARVENYRIDDRILLGAHNFSKNLGATSKFLTQDG